MSDDIVNMSLTLDLTLVNAAFGDVEKRGRALGPVWRELRRPFAHDQKDHAQKETDDGAAWAKRSPITEGRRKARNRRVRVTKSMRTIGVKRFSRGRSTPKKILGRLPKAYVFAQSALSMKFTSRVAWSGAHASGGRVGRGRRVRLPRRRWFWLSRSFMSTVETTIGKHLVLKWGQK